MRTLVVSMLVVALAGLAQPALADGQKLKIISWADYIPAEVIAAFHKETGIDVEVTLSNNEEMISKLRATHGAGYDLAQPSVDRIAGPLRDLGIYKSLDLSKVNMAQFQPAILEVVRKQATVDGKLYGLPYVWGTDGLVVNTKKAKVADYLDLCKPEYKGKTTLRPLRPTLMAFAFAMGKDPFALYGDPKAYGALMDQVGATLSACKQNLRFFADNKDQVLNGMRTGELVAAMMWDTGGTILSRENPDIQYVVPKSGAMGWIDTFVLPARGRNDAAAYAWINFTMRPDIAAKIATSVGSFSAAIGADALVTVHPKPVPFQSIHWYPAIPAGLEEMEGKVLDRLRAAG